MRTRPRLRSVAVALAFAAGASLATADAGAPARDTGRARPTPGWDVRLAPAGEPGEPFEMSGIVRDQDGTALANRPVHVYHADARGAYARGSGPPRLADTLRTDASGRYRIRTIFPGSYGGFAAHVHFEILGPRGGTGFVNVRPQGRDAKPPGTSIPVPRSADGVWRLDLDLRPGPIRSSGAARSTVPFARHGPDSVAWAPPRRDTSGPERPR